jgi:putative FmdB family regulatory protein
VPIYEFSCLGCRHTFEVFGRYESREQKQVCPQCEGTNTKALFSTFAVTTTAGAEASASTGGGCGGCGGACSCAN